MTGRPPELRPCGWCGVPQTATQDRTHRQECPERPKPIAAAQKRLREFNDPSEMSRFRAGL